MIYYKLYTTGCGGSQEKILYIDNFIKVKNLKNCHKGTKTQRKTV